MCLMKGMLFAGRLFLVGLFVKENRICQNSKEWRLAVVPSYERQFDFQSYSCRVFEALCRLN